MLGLIDWGLIRFAWNSYRPRAVDGDVTKPLQRRENYCTHFRAFHVKLNYTKEEEQFNFRTEEKILNQVDESDEFDQILTNNGFSYLLPWIKQNLRLGLFDRWYRPSLTFLLIV
jgi:hypothetical protein